jgi:hypothetical protein
LDLIQTVQIACPFAFYNRSIVDYWTKSTSAVHRRSTTAPAIHQGINGQDSPTPLVKSFLCHFAQNPLQF